MTNKPNRPGADPLIDYLVNECGGTVTDIAPTGEALYREYQAFTRLDRRDDWYWSLPHEDRSILIEHRAVLWRASREHTA